MSCPLICVEALSVHAGTEQLLEPISFTLGAGQALVIMGETGAGKSLLAQAILGTLPHGLQSSGSVHINGQRIDQLGTTERSRFWGRTLAILPQEPWRALDPLMSASSQVRESHRLVAGLDRQAASSATREDFATLELEGAEARLPGALSGGMAQRVAFAAATAANAPILIADEPTKGLDTERSDKVISLLAEQPDRGGALIAITHEVSAARHMGGNILVLKSGRLVECGATEEVLSKPSALYTQQLLDAEPRAWPRQPPARRGDRVLCADDVSIHRGSRCLLQHVNLELHAGERIAITGPSGVGKTSLLDVLAGIRRPELGRVTRMSSVGPTGIQKLYQDPPAAFPDRVSLRKSLCDVARLHGVDWSVVSAYLSQLGVSPTLMDRRPAAVSGGELQRISIARALTARPAVLLADEPTSRLDPITQRDTLAMIADIASEHGIAVVLVTHELDIADRWADRQIQLGSSFH